MTRFLLPVLPATSLLLVLCALTQAAPLPELAFADTRGAVHSLTAMTASNNPVVFVYWQPWCSRCRHEAPEIAKAAAAHAGHLQFFGVVAGTDEMIDEKQVGDFLAQAKFTFPQVRDRSLALTEAMHVVGTPTVIIVGKGNQILYRGNGPPADWARF